jgi:hypothetical protein
MGTLTLTTMRSLIRAALNESSTTSITNTELNAAINDGYKDVCAKTGCYEKLITIPNIASGVRLVPLTYAAVSNYVMRVNYVEYYKTTSDTPYGYGLPQVYPQTFGHMPIDTYVPQFWFQWGNYLSIETVPDVATYDIYVYAACYPSTVLSGDSDLPSCAPAEFHEAIWFFATAFIAMKLKRWADCAVFYNKYIDSIQPRKYEYVMKFPEGRVYHDLPANVSYS